MSDCAILPALGLQSARLTIAERVLRLPTRPCAHARRAFRQSIQTIGVQEGPGGAESPGFRVETADLTLTF